VVVVFVAAVLIAVVVTVLIFRNCHHCFSSSDGSGGGGHRGRGVKGEEERIRSSGSICSQSPSGPCFLAEGRRKERGKRTGK